MVHALYTSSDDRLSMDQVLFNSLLYFQRYALDKPNAAKIRREVTPYILVIVLWFLHSAISLMALYQCIKFHLITFNTFKNMLWTSSLLQKFGREKFLFLHSAFSLMDLYRCIKLHSIPFFTFRDMLRTGFLLQKLKREVTT